MQSEDYTWINAIDARNGLCIRVHPDSALIGLRGYARATTPRLHPGQVRRGGAIAARLTEPTDALEVTS